MKLRIAFITFFILFSTFSFSQKERKKDSIINNVFTVKPENYFSLQKYFRRIRFSEDQIKYLLEKSETETYALGQIFAKNLYGRFYRNKTQYDKSILKYKEALELAREVGSLEAEVVTLNQLGVVYRRQDKIKTALNYHHLALEMLTKATNQTKDIKISTSISINSIGNIYLALKQYELALERFEKSIGIQQDVEDKRGLAINHQNIGFAYKNLGDFEIALKNYKKSLDYNNQNNDELGKVICHNSISDILIKQGKYEEAYKYIIEVLPLAEKIGNKYYLSEVYNTLGWVYIKTDKLDKGEKYVKMAFDIAKKNNMPSSLSAAYNHLSELNLKRKEYREAFDNYKKAIDIDRETFNEKNIVYVTSLINKYENEVSKNRLESLAREKDIAELNLTRNRNILIITLVSLALFSVVLYSIYRQRLLNNEKKILMLEQEALQSQMNPHFVFNALNSIKLYIINNEQKNAVYYLNKFSKLIRNILDASKVKEVTLHEELKTMNLYMSIENIRFSNEIEYVQKIDDGLNLERIKVPPLILQPFLENSIWHGLSSKKGEKKVELSVSKISDEFIQIDIEDNGIGREEAFKIKSNKSLNRKSIGIDLTKERLQNFTNEFKNHFSLEYFDLKDDEGKPTGTRVSIRVPIV
ncbi:hypothetical protein WH52_13510 [Tenacibaculum holothuriorum]|uniref:Signal transduction histidine kinase internal region domain-containing protein n=1 Tax=Tenacibaculum holothuriorum TaxID=1635173 RepID=A0A1Y2P9F2_9FLAO|nr:tetratricopeptide repeat protein [Tenacibaculum holothuriorum]OSY87073.1 hypothetical protein WH52_13510 [Tenacibaculum holothuriorum]